MNEQQYQQGRDALISTLDWTSESIDEFARLTLMKSVREGGKDDLIFMLNECKSEFNRKIDNDIRKIEEI